MIGGHDLRHERPPFRPQIPRPRAPLGLLPHGHPLSIVEERGCRGDDDERSHDAGEKGTDERVDLAERMSRTSIPLSTTADCWKKICQGVIVVPILAMINVKRAAPVNLLLNWNFGQ